MLALNSQILVRKLARGRAAFRGAVKRGNRTGSDKEWRVGGQDRGGSTRGDNYRNERKKERRKGGREGRK